MENTELEMAFRTAVERSNILERSFELVPIVAYANNDDSFLMEKTGMSSYHTIASVIKI